MKKYHISFSGGELTRMKNISTTSILSATNVTTNIDLVPVLDKEFLDDNMDNAVKQALCIIMDYLKGFSFSINDINVIDQYHSNGKAKYIVFKANDQIQGFFKLEEIE